MVEGWWKGGGRVVVEGWWKGGGGMEKDETFEHGLFNNTHLK